MSNAILLAPLSPATAVTGGGTVVKGDANYLFNDYAGVIWETQCNASGNVAAVQLDLGADTLLDTAMVFGIELLPTSGSGMYVQYATQAQGPFTGGSAVDTVNCFPYAGSATPVNGKGVSLWLAPTPITARYVVIGWQAGAAGKSIRASRIVLGKRIQLQRNFSMGGTFGVRDLGSLDFSRRAVLARSRGKKLRTAGLTFSNVRKDEVEAQTKPLLERIGNTEMIALLTDPATDAQRQTRAYYGPLVGDLAHAQRNAAAWEAKVNVVSIF